MSLSRALAVKCGLVFAGCALAASLVLDREDETPGRIAEPTARAKAAGPSKQQGSARSAAPASTPLDISLLNRPAATDLEENLFALPRPPAPPPPRTRAVAAPPPKPTAPPLPFKYLGTMIDRGTTTLFITQGGQNHSVKPGEVVSDVYRLEQLSETHATFVYLPLEERQTLPIGGRK